MKFKLIRGNQNPQIRLQIDFFWSLVIIQCTARSFTGRGRESAQAGVRVCKQSLQKHTKEEHSESPRSNKKVFKS